MMIAKTKQHWISKMADRVIGKQSIPPTMERQARQRQRDGKIDVRDLMETYTVEELCDTAEEYYRSRGPEDWSGLIAKPFACIQETPELLICFAHLLHGLQPVANATILDFGAGPGWASHALTQLGAKVIVCDVSATGLQIAEERYRRHRIEHPHTPPQFSHFNGRTFNLPDKSVDRIICIDAFHHIPNPQEVILELSRILKDDGIAAFAEPGPDHSWSPGAQYEMKHFKVVENDIVIEDIWEFAQQAGFTDLKMSLFGTQPFHVDLDGFKDFLAGGTTSKQWTSQATHYMSVARRLFFLSKGDPRPKDSRTTDGLRCKIETECISSEIGGPLRYRIRAKNTGTLHWLQASQGIGSIYVGCHLRNLDDQSEQLGYVVKPAPLEESQGLMPGKDMVVDLEIPRPEKPGRYEIAFDLVAQQVAWFSSVGNSTACVSLTINP